MLNNLLTIGKTALSNFQVAISVTGGNIANASTSDYCDRTVDFTTDGVTVNGVGCGTDISAIVRQFNSFLESQCLGQTSTSSYQSVISSNLSLVESYFNDSSSTGISSSLDTFMASLESLSTSASNASVRTSAIESASSLSEMLNTIDTNLSTEESSMNGYISSDVDTVNSLVGQLAALNKDIGSASSSSGLLDKRDQLMTKLAKYVDIKASYSDNGQVRVTTGEGQTLVDGTTAYSFKVEGPKSTAALSADSGFTGKLYFSGSSSNELTIKTLTSGDCSGTSNAATYEVSLDGGKSWVEDANGNKKVFKAGDANNKSEVDGVSIWFGTATDSDTAPTTNLTAGDKFDVMPKSGIYWITASGGEVNVTPLTGNDSANRLSGGSIAGLYATRDKYVGDYQDKLNAFSESLIWNMNRTHSQGAGLTGMSSVTGDYAVTSTTKALSNSGLYWADKLTSGNISFAIYDSSTGSNGTIKALDFSSVTPGTSSFDPSKDSLQDVCAAINTTYSGKLTASIANGKLSIEAASGVTFQVAEDSSGLMAGLGINTLFSGTDASSIAVNTVVADDPSRLCAGHVNSSGEVTTGDNQTALALAAYSTTSVMFNTANGTASNTLSGYVTSLAAKVGSDTSGASTDSTYASTLLTDVQTQISSASGVSLDEEYTRLLQYQQNYQAAAKLIQTANDMFDTILSLKSS